MADEPIRRGAVVAAAVMGLGITYFMVDKNRRCSTFSNVWDDPGDIGGLHLQEHVIEDAEHWTRQRLRSILLAQETPNRDELHEGLAGYIADCDWESSRKKKKGRQVWDSLGKIVNVTLAQYNKDPTGFMKG
jgi:hypothetical protein